MWMNWMVMSSGIHVPRSWSDQALFYARILLCIVHCTMPRTDAEEYLRRFIYAHLPEPGCRTVLQNTLPRTQPFRRYRPSSVCLKSHDSWSCKMLKNVIRKNLFLAAEKLFVHARLVLLTAPAPYVFPFEGQCSSGALVFILTRRPSDPELPISKLPENNFLFRR